VTSVLIWEIEEMMLADKYSDLIHIFKLDINEVQIQILTISTKIG